MNKNVKNCNKKLNEQSQASEIESTQEKNIKEIGRIFQDIESFMEIQI